MNIYVTGIGAISSIGLTVDEHFDALISRKHGIQPTKIAGLDRELLAAAVPLSDQELNQRCNAEVGRVSRTSLLGILAAEECWGKNTFLPGIKTGIISGTSVGGMDISEKAYREFLETGSTDFTTFLLHDSGNTTEIIADCIGITDYVNTISTACSSGSNAIMHGARLIKAGILDRVLVGGTDALSQFTISGFSSLMIYNEEICKPFDNDRNGLNLGEGAGFLLLENDRCREITGNNVLGTVVGWGNAADAFHQTATSPDAKGAVLAIEKAFSIAEIKPEQVDYINAHGTGTKNNDLTETIALQTIFGNEIPPFSSTKSYTGHTLAASGALEAVFCILSLKNKVFFPNLHFQTEISETRVKPLTEVKEVTELNYILSNSFGFGGNCTSLIFSKGV